MACLTGSVRLVGVASTALIIACTSSTGAQQKRGGDGAQPNLIAFVGRRLSLDHVKPHGDEGSLDSEFRVRVQVLQLVFGEYKAGEMEFISYVHTGHPSFQDDEFGLVYVSRYDGTWVQQKYIFQPVHRTSDGRWASCGDPYERISDVHRHGVRAEPVTFDPPVVFDIKMEEEDQGYYMRFRAFEAPFFRVENGQATCLMGNYPRELFRVMADGYLRARGVTK